MNLVTNRDETMVTADFLKFSHPFKSIFYGSTNSGKTHHALTFIKNRDKLITPTVDKVFVCYGSANAEQYQDLLFDPNVEMFSDSSPDNFLDSIYKAPGKKLLFIDDFCTWMMESKKSQSLFMTNARHSNLSVIITTQALNNGRGSSISNLLKNSDYLFMFRSPMMSPDVRRLSKQLFPSTDADFLPSALDLATELNPYNPILIRLNSKFPYDEIFRVSSDVVEATILTDIFIYIPRK